MQHQDDDPIFCRRCTEGEAWADEEICRTCQGELEADSGWTVGWRKMWEREKEAKRKRRSSEESS